MAQYLNNLSGMRYGRFKYMAVFLFLSSSVSASEVTPMMERLADSNYQMTETEKAFQKENGKKYYSILEQYKSEPKKGIEIYSKVAYEDCKTLKTAYFDATDTDIHLCQEVAKALPELTLEVLKQASAEEQIKFYQIITEATLLQSQGKTEEVNKLLQENLR